MSFDIYPALSGATATWTQMELISNNMANSSTSGFKAGEIAFELSGTGGDGDVYVGTTESMIDHSDGNIIKDDDPTHLALQGNGFFAIQTPEGMMLSRNGRFSLNARGELVTGQGNPLLDTGGNAIAIPPGESLQVTTSGEVLGSKSGHLAQIHVVTGPAVPESANIWRPTGALQTSESFTITQGALEGSNVDPMATMVDLIEASRYFEVFQKAMQASDELDQRVNKLGG